MNIIIHGATDQNSTNFGDFIYGNELYKICSSNGNNVCYYNPSVFFQKYTEGYVRNKIRVRDADLIVYIPGGYFGEVKKPGIKRCLKNFFRYMPIGLSAVILKKDIAIVGLGAGPIYYPLLKLPLTVIVRNAKMITVRDNDSKMALEKLGAKNVYNYYDMIASYDLSHKGIMTEQLQKLLHETKEKKILIVHYNHSEAALFLFSKAVSLFIEYNPDYKVIVACDSIIEKSPSLFREFSKNCKGALYFSYDNPFEFIELLKKSSMILTCKLHAGVVSALFGKSVVSVADHYEKTSRFYRLLNDKGRCAKLGCVEINDLWSMLEKYKDIPTIVPEKILNTSRNHRLELLKLIERKRGNKCLD